MASLKHEFIGQFHFFYALWIDHHSNSNSINSSSCHPKNNRHNCIRLKLDRVFRGLPIKLRREKEIESVAGNDLVVVVFVSSLLRAGVRQVSGHRRIRLGPIIQTCSVRIDRYLLGHAEAPDLDFAVEGEKQVLRAEVRQEVAWNWKNVSIIRQPFRW